MHHSVIEMCTFLLQNVPLWNIWLMHCGICQMGLSIADAEPSCSFLHKLHNRMRYAVLHSRKWDVTKTHLGSYPDCKAHGANMGPIWGRQDPGGPHVGPMNFAIWVSMCSETSLTGILKHLDSSQLSPPSVSSRVCNIYLQYWTSHPQ